MTLNEIMEKGVKDIEAELERQGFHCEVTKGKTRYWIKEGSRYALAIARSKGQEYLIIIEDVVMAWLGEHKKHGKYPSISIKTRRDGAVPVVFAENKPLHRCYVVNKGPDTQMDHINHNTYFVSRDNLRVCTSEENNMNRSNAVIRKNIIKKNARGYYLKKEYIVPGTNADVCKQKLQAIGMEVSIKGSGERVTLKVKSPYFPDQGGCYHVLRDVEDVVRGQFAYHLENDFSDTLNLLIFHHVLGIITEKQMYEMNREYIKSICEKSNPCFFHYIR